MSKMHYLCMIGVGYNEWLCCLARLPGFVVVASCAALLDTLDWYYVKWPRSRERIPVNTLQQIELFMETLSLAHCWVMLSCFNWLNELPLQSMTQCYKMPYSMSANSRSNGCE